MARDPLTNLNGKTFDVAIIGAGINGCGAAQQLAAKGYSVLIIDKGDFAEGATSKSSRLLHCGLRHLAPGKSLWEMLYNPLYLATALINAKAAMKARSDIAQTLPELTRPTKFCFPIYNQDPYPPALVDMAFGLLHLLGPKDLPLDYKRYGPADMASVPFAGYLRDASSLKGMSTFREYLFDWPERIAIDTLLDARRMGTVMRNYTTFKTLSKLDDGSFAVTLQDTLNPQEQIIINAKLVLNISGAWSDQVTSPVKPDMPQKVLKLKGAHIAIKLPEEFTNWGMIAMNRVKEPFYCVPNRGLHIVGLNRVPYARDASGVIAEVDEVDWLLGELNYLMPRLGATRSDIHYTMAGLQPITFDPKAAHGSRAIKIHDLESEGYKNLLTLTGGPIMTYRLVGKDLAKAVSKRISPSSKPQKLSMGASDITKTLHASRNISHDIQATSEVLRHIAENEQPNGLADVLFRRTGIAWNEGQGRGQVEEVAEILSAPLGWDKARTGREIQIYRDYLENEFFDHQTASR